MRIRQLLAPLLLVVLAVACGQPVAQQSDGSTPDTPGPATPGPATPSPAQAPGQGQTDASGEPADAMLAAGLDFTLPAVGGGQIVGAELAGKDVALWFWAPW